MMSSDYTVGDLVEAVKGETVVRGRLQIDPFLGELFIPGLADPGYVNTLAERLGFTLTVIEKAPQKLPTEPGTVITWRAGDAYYVPRIAYLDAGESRAGWYISNAHAGWYTPERLQRVIGRRTFTVLEPVPVTAKKVLDALGEYLDSQLVGRTKDEIIAALAEEFGVTDDPR